jgi:protein-disulfide isomerase
MRAFVSGLLFAVAAMGQAAPAAKKSFLDKATLEAYVRHLFVWPAQIAVEVSEARPSKVDGLLEVKVTGTLGRASETSHFFVSRDGQSVVQGTAFAVNENPFKANLDRIQTAFAPGTGTAGAPVVVVMYSDFQCPHCRDEAQMIRANLLQTFAKEVRLYFRDFPLEHVHDWAKTAAMAGRCVWREDAERFWDYHDWVFGRQESLRAETFRREFAAFLSEKQIAAVPILQCLDGKATEADVKASFAEGQAVAVTSTPTLFVNGRRLAGKLSWPQLKQIIEFEVEYQKTAKNAGDNCGCELTLPSVLPQ